MQNRTNIRPRSARTTRVAWFCWLAFAAPAAAQSLTLPEIPPKAAWQHTHQICEDAWCKYPPQRPRLPVPPLDLLALRNLNEIEPNDDIAEAQVLPLGTNPGQDRDIDINGNIINPSDVDAFRFTAKKGDIIGIAGLASGNMDPLVGVFDSAGSLLILNDDDGGLSFLLPPATPFPPAQGPVDSTFTWFCPEDGDYHIAVFPFDATTIGPYKLKIRSRRPFFEAQADAPARQIVYLDFDGFIANPALIWESDINQEVAFSPLSEFIPDWGFVPADENAVIDKVVEIVEQNFDEMRNLGLNGNRPDDGIDGHFDVEVRNSRDDPDPAGQPFVTRVVIGGTIQQLGIQTIGLAEFIDPGNFQPEDHSIVLLDLLSASAADPNSINAIPRDPSMSKTDLVGLVIGNIVSHEIGHTIGCWHTELFNASQDSIMDTGGNLLARAEVGNDLMAGTSDDTNNMFLTDEYDFFEQVAFGLEPTDLRVSFALSTGARVPDTTPPSIFSTSPPRDAQLGSLTSITLILTEPVTGMTAGAIRINGQPATSLSGDSSGPYLFGGFSSVGFGTVTVQFVGAGVTDAADLAIPDDAWNYVVADAIPPAQTDIMPLPDSVLAFLDQVEGSFSEAVVDVDPAALTVNGSAATDVTGSGAGPYTFTGFAPPAHGSVDVQFAAGGARDAAENDVDAFAWQYQINDCNGNRMLDNEDLAAGRSNDCNNNDVPDDCESDLLSLDTGEPLNIQPNEIIELSGQELVTGGTLPLQFQWTLRGNPNIMNTFEPSAEFGPVPAGTYVVRVMVTDAAGCQATGFINITVGDGGGTIGLAPATAPPNAQACGASCAPNTAMAVLMLTMCLITVRRVHRARRFT